MKILHISTHLTGGAALAALRLHRSMIESGIESRLLTLDGECDGNMVTTFKVPWAFHNNKLQEKIVRSVFYRLNIGMGRYWRMHDEARKHGECQYTYPISPYRVENHPLVKWADIIHLHFCDDFINYPTFFKRVKKPVVWTLHDIGIEYGGFHYKNDYERLIPYFRQIENEFLRIKRDSLLNAENIHIVSLSQEMFDLCHRIDYLKNKANYIIPNGVDTTQFKLLNRNNCRKELCMPPQMTILLFVAEYVQTKSKGLDLLKEAIATLKKDNILLCIVGNHPKDMHQKDIINTRYFGKVYDVNTMSKIYSSADYLVMPSSQEVCPQTPLEAMSCGTPVVVFPTGAMKDYVHSEQGVVCNSCTVSALKKGLSKAMNRVYDRRKLRDYVSDIFSPSKVAKMYIDIYSNMAK